MQAKYTYYPDSMAPHSVRRDAQTYHYATDMRGSVLALFSSSNTVVNQYAYLPFGEGQTTSETVANPLRFAGRELDGSSGLYYNNARWYDPSLHRFVSEDPIGTDGGMNLYSYVENDPVNSADPSGLMGCTRRGSRGVADILGVRVVGPWIHNGPWQCDYWGMPVQDYRDLRTEYARICTWSWHCPGEQDPWAEHSSCRLAHCELRPPSPPERKMVVDRLNTLRTEDDFCRRVSAAGLDMANRQLGIFDNNASYLERRNGRLRRRYVWGNAPYHIRLGGPVMYLYRGRMAWDSGEPIVHEAIHGLFDPNFRIPSYYSDWADTTEIGLSIDESARYCMRLRGR